MHLLRKCPCPVWLIKPEKQKSYRRILAAVDVDDAIHNDALSRQILEMASSLALSDFAELHVVHAWEPVAESALRDALRYARGEYYCLRRTGKAGSHGHVWMH